MRLSKKLKVKYKVIFIVDNNLRNLFSNKIFIGIQIFFLYKKNEKFKNELDDYIKFKNITKKICSDYLFVDDYRLSSIWHQRVAKNIKNTVIIDDLNNRKFFGNYYLNYKSTNIKKLKKDVQKNSINKNVKLLLGSKYCIIDDNLKKIKTKKFNILINFGNSFDFSEIKHFLTKLIEEDFFKKLSIYIFIGIYSKNFQYLLKNKYKKKFKIIYKKIFQEKIIGKADLFIGSSGHSIYDMSYLNTPSIFFSLSNNQDNKINDLRNLGHYFIFNNHEYKKKMFIKFIIKIIKNVRKLKKLNLKKKVKLKKTGSQIILKKLNLI